ncbi:hypothetical protein NEF87_003506 [Candidatus Lokiarchaeum ossiferum]|uniref:DUF304 domain-containing protein n=1 Tax=Candidatus Lokiarchaeum ossiferum TaxID=2951803 RepID=A0ABY6HXB2_9ARCH|nr:hypothetical protein NEF87_003506 [Candidatus Lokiarchaeum sp. B-35]
MVRLSTPPNKNKLQNLSLNVSYSPREKNILFTTSGIFISTLIGWVFFLKNQMNGFEFIIGFILVFSLVVVIDLIRFKIVKCVRIEFMNEGLFLTDNAGNRFFISHQVIKGLDISQRVSNISFTLITSKRSVTLRIYVQDERPLLITGICDTSVFSDNQYSYYSIVQYCLKVYNIENSNSHIQSIIKSIIFVFSLILFSAFVISLLLFK